MKIALVCEFFPRSAAREIHGGVEARTYFIGRILARRHDVTVYAVKEPGTPPEDRFEGMRVVRVGPETEYSQASSLHKRLAFMMNATRALRGEDYDVVDGCSIMAYPAAWRGGRGARIMEYQDVWAGRWVSNLGWKGIFGEALERYTLSRGWDHIVAGSGFTRDSLVRYGIAPERITVAYNGIDLAEYSAVKAEKFPQPTVCAISRLVSYKRIGDLVRAAAAVRESVPDLKVRVIGVGPERESLEALSRSLGLSDCVDFMGYVERHADVLRTLKSSHAFCLPSVVEGFGISVVEAMALGIPYVASDIPAIREVTRGGAGGLLVGPRDPDSLAAGLIRVLSGEVRGGAPFIGEYDWSCAAAKVEEVAEGVAGARRG
jgi:glycosyltransferase involved in cell wall biosynthesis